MKNDPQGIQENGIRWGRHLSKCQWKFAFTDVTEHVTNIPDEVHTAARTLKGCSSIIRTKDGNAYVRPMLGRLGQADAGKAILDWYETLCKIYFLCIYVMYNIIYIANQLKHDKPNCNCFLISGLSNLLT